MKPSFRRHELLNLALQFRRATDGTHPCTIRLPFAIAKLNSTYYCVTIGTAVVIIKVDEQSQGCFPQINVLSLAVREVAGT